uniref:Uncharacterized protein n=1 Tax=Oryza sativa subsp. japonica TaxID=39947 RepID=Q5Z8U8_ORYSJ|nr:hypothetical protein [Oryza sativa Japonica Group]BAD53806.1 hypothetical protein [Oryza sativa Japonica Group]
MIGRRRGGSWSAAGGGGVGARVARRGRGGAPAKWERGRDGIELPVPGGQVKLKSV